MKKTIKTIIILIILIASSSMFIYGIKLLSFTQPETTTTETQIDEFAMSLVRPNVKITSKYYDIDNNYINEETASGVIYDYDSGFNYLITNFHAVSSSNVDHAEYYVMAYNGLVFTGSYVRGDETLDLAIIKFETELIYPSVDLSDDYVSPIEVNTVVELDSVIAVGNPLGVMNIVTTGVLNNIYIDVEFYNYPVLRHSAEINLGSSGGALYTEDGNIIGINTWSGENEDYYAIPVNIILGFVNELY